MTSSLCVQSRDYGVGNGAVSAASDYEWPDLPPVAQFKDAITRQKVSAGISYLLPADKSGNSIENVYRTNLRVMFKEPYRSLDLQGSYDDAGVRDSAKFHLKPNTPSEQYTFSNRCKSSTTNGSRWRLNASSAKAHRQYVTSAPAKGLTGRKGAGSSQKLQRRSRLYLPMNAQPAPEAARLQKEAEKIIRSVDQRDTQISNKEGLGKTGTPLSSTNAPPLPNHKDKLLRKTGGFSSYQEVKDFQVPERKPLPDVLRSPHLSEEKNLQIWYWLNDNETITELDFFLDLCS